METKELKTDVLNDLILINNDRINGYEKAVKELTPDDSDLKTLFISMISQSHQFKMELATEVSANGGEIETGTTTSGKIYRAWMDVKAVFTGHDRKSILENCHFGEDAAQKAYESALEEEGLPTYLREVIIRQQEQLENSHDQIKELRDQIA